MPPKKEKASAGVKVSGIHDLGQIMRDKKQQCYFQAEAPAKEDYDGIIRIEFCTTGGYKPKADKFFAELCDLLPEQKLKPDIVPGDIGSFEIYVRKVDQALEEGVLVWSGQNKGPPTAKKFPKVADLISAIKEALNLK